MNGHPRLMRMAGLVALPLGWLPVRTDSGASRPSDALRERARHRPGGGTVARRARRVIWPSPRDRLWRPGGRAERSGLDDWIAAAQLASLASRLRGRGLAQGRGGARQRQRELPARR